MPNDFYTVAAPVSPVGEVVTTSTSSAQTTGTYGPGRVQVVCSQLTYCLAGASPTAIAGTSLAIPPNWPFVVDLSQPVKLAFVAGAAGTAAVSRLS